MSTPVTWPGAGRRGPAAHARTLPAGGTYDGSVTSPDWGTVHGRQDWQDWQDPRDWGPLPEMYPDHPSAPVQRVQLPAGHPSGSMPAARSVWQPATSGPDAGGYRRGTGPLGPRAESAAGWFQDNHAARLAHEAQAYAAAIRDAAERDAAVIMRAATVQATAIRDAAERDAAAQRAALDSMTGELSRVAAFVTETLTAPPMPATAPALPPARPARTVTKPGAPATRPAGPAGPAKPKVTPATVPQAPQKPGRQHRAMRVATYATASLMAFAVLAGATEVGLHGFKFFVFRESGVGSTGGNSSDQQFLAQQAAAHHNAQAPRGRHAKN